jgi:NAD(P)-dependent dehydrogenase (short-subunit alcohol dehydrogenase family)
VTDEEGRYRPLGAPLASVPEPAEATALPVSGRRLALVTGGHRRLGAAIATALAAAGYALAIHGSHDVELEGGLERALDDHGTSWEGFVADFTDLDAAEELIARISGVFGRPPDLLVNSAAIFGQDRLANVSGDDLMRHFAVNCAAPVLLTKAFATVPSGPVDRSVINILDQRIDHPHGDQLAYTISKMGLAGFTQIAARELAPKVRVNGVAPGLTLVTPDYTPAQTRDLAEAMPLAHLPRPAQIAEAVLYLASATAVTGQVLYVDVGAHMRSYPRDFMHL